MTQLTATAPVRAAGVVGLGSYRPERRVTNDELAPRIDSSDEWIRERSGIVERRWAAPDESVADMATIAATGAVERAGISPEQVGMVLIATVTHPYQTPSAAAEVSARIGARNAAAMDISSACAGFCYGVNVASDLVRGGSVEYVVVVGVEKLSDWVNHEDRGTAFLFADGAGAVVIGPSDVPAIGPVVWGADGDQRPDDEGRHPRARAKRATRRRCSRASGQSAISEPAMKTKPATQSRLTSGLTSTLK